MSDLEAVIGLEVHAQLATQSKLFCACSTAFGAQPNANTCAVCLGMPGALPVPNDYAVALAVRAGLGLGCSIALASQWSRKNYFYPDLPKGYQITQFDRPIAQGGELAFSLPAEAGLLAGEVRSVRIRRVHMEEDAGKSVHGDGALGGRSYVDFNRGGVPLIEIVSEPDVRSGVEAAAYMRALRQILRYLGVCDGNMEEGSLRCDANVSVRKRGDTKLGTRTELKNINSFRFVQQAIEFEIARQENVLAGGGSIVQETRLWDAEAKVTRPMRSKEEAHDYRYFPEPDLPDLQLEEAWVQGIHETLPELPAAKVRRYTQQLGLSDNDAAVLTEDAEVAHYFEEAVALHTNAKAIANWIINELLRELRGRAPSEVSLTPSALAELVALIDDGTISGKIAKDLFAELLEKGGSAKGLVETRGLKQVSDTSSIEPAVLQVLAANPKAVESYRAGKTNVLGFLVGQVMKATGGKANPKLVNALLTEKLRGG